MYRSRIQAIYDLLNQKGIDVGEDGKGRSAWTAALTLPPLKTVHVIALHDCDIVTYDRELLVVRLCYPVTHPNIGFEFCKGYYSRITDQLARPGYTHLRVATHPFFESNVGP